MNRHRLLAIGATLLFVFAAHAPQATPTAGDAAKSVSSSDPAGLPSVEAQLKVLTDKLSLTNEQQDKVKPILKELHDATEKIAQDKTLSYEERLAKVRPQRYKTDERIRALLNEDQKKKLDLYEQGPHGEMHGKLTGTAPAASRPPQ